MLGLKVYATTMNHGEMGSDNSCDPYRSQDKLTCRCKERIKKSSSRKNVEARILCECHESYPLGHQGRRTEMCPVPSVTQTPASEQACHVKHFSQWGTRSRILGDRNWIEGPCHSFLDLPGKTDSSESYKGYGRAGLQNILLLGNLPTFQDLSSIFLHMALPSCMALPS